MTSWRWSYPGLAFTKTIINLNVGKYCVYLPRRFSSRLADGVTYIYHKALSLGYYPDLEYSQSEHAEKQNPLVGYLSITVFAYLSFKFNGVDRSRVDCPSSANSVPAE